MGHGVCIHVYGHIIHWKLLPNCTTYLGGYHSSCVSIRRPNKWTIHVICELQQHPEVPTAMGLYGVRNGVCDSVAKEARPSAREQGRG